MSDLVPSSDNGILTLTFNRAERHNALTLEMREALLETLVSERNSLYHRAIVITGAGGSFCSGADLELNKILERRATIEGTMKTGINPIIALIREIPVPVIAAVDGAAAGAGVGLALAADFMLVSDRARFHISFARIGASPDAGVIAQLVHKIGAARATKLAMLGETLSGDDAAHLGLAHSMTTPDQLETETFALAKQLAEGPTVSFGMTKRLINAANRAGDPANLALEAECQARSFATRDFEEGVTAYSQKRRPEFRGH